MAENLVEMLQNSLTASFAGDVAKHLGESEMTTRSALGAAVPAVLAGLLQQSSTPSGAAQLFQSITGPQIESGLGQVGSWLGGGDRTANLLSQGSSLLNSIFGRKTGAVAEAIGAASGMRISSVSTLLTMAMPAIFALLKRYISQNQLDAVGLTALLARQRDTLRSHMDERLTGALGLAPSALAGTAAAAASRVGEAARDIGSGAAQTASTAYAAAGDALSRVPDTPIVRRPWFWGAVVAAALLLFGLFNYWTTTLDRTTQTAQNVASTVDKSMRSLELPGGTKIDVASGGFLDSLTAFLASKDTGVGKSFTFDELQFETGSSTLAPMSNRQLQYLANVLKAYGNVSINVAGYTDNMGDPAANKRLSAERAAAVKQALVGMGVPAARVTDDGYGQEKPIASNDTEEGRAKNRRVEVVVLKR